MPSRIRKTQPSDNIPQGSFKYSPLRALRIQYIGFLKSLFSLMDAGCWKWQPDDSSEIVITDQHPIRTENIGARPAVTVTRGAVQFYTLGLDDMLDYKFETAKKRKTVLVPGVMTINCCSRNEIESEELAWLIAEHMWLLREQLMGSAKFFEIGRQPSISPATSAEGIVAGDGGEEWYCTSVSSPFQFPRMSQVTPLGDRILENLNMCLNVETLRVLSQDPRVAAMNQGGVPTSPTHAAEYPVAQVLAAPDPYTPASDAGGRSPHFGAARRGQLSKAAHPLDPAVEVTLRPTQGNRPGLRPPAMGGRALPIASTSVKESGQAAAGLMQPSKV